jgi:nicotinamidase-related amidase
VIDLQEAFVAEGARMWTPENIRIVPRVKRLIEHCRKRGVPVIFTEHCHDDAGRDKGLMWDVPLNRPIKEGALRLGARETATVRDLAPLPGEKVIPKHRYSAFYDTDLDTYLRGCGVDTVIISGCMTNYCCGATARDAFFRNYKVIFGEDITATDSRELHDAELKTLRRGYARVIPLAEILRELERD